jgi:DNA sulfur modification protein DndD
MKLEQLELENFRQFYGYQEVSFAQGAQDNVTVVHGDNGAGKTTLLNAFTWLFYDEITLPQPEKIVTERALSEAAVDEIVDARVSLSFEHENAQYKAARVQRFQKQAADDLAGSRVEDDLSLEFIDADGNHKERNNPSSALKQILPQRLREIFFFDGETISEMTADDGQKQVQSAIRNIMGLEILERAIRHLGAVEKRFEKTIQKHGSNELSDLVSEKSRLDDRWETMENERKNLKESRSETEKELEQVNERLADLEDSRELQIERNRLAEQKESVEEDIANKNDRLGTRISDSGHLPFAMPAVESTARMLQDKRRKGEIPSEIKTQFVEDLLEVEECICGRPLGHDSPAREEVSAWRGRAGSGELEEAAMNIVGRLGEIGKGQATLYENLEDTMSERASKRDRKREIMERLDEISERLVDIDTEDVPELEARRQLLRDRKNSLTEDIGAISADIERAEQDLDELKEDISAAREENETANTARRRAQTAGYLGQQIETLFRRYQNNVRESVNNRVNETFQRIIEKQYYAQISDDYELRILKDVGDTTEEDVAKSTGERQVASLSFIASLVSLAKDRYQSEEDATYFSGGIYPMLMDSPFGYLDPTYQERVSQRLPEMGEQVIVLVTESQWSDAVAGEMEAIAGEQYELEYYDGQQYDYTEIVSRGSVA